MVLLCLVAGMYLLAPLVAASESAMPKFSDGEAIHAILGEARGEGLAGMYAVAHAIRNRGTLRGVYGLIAEFKVDDDTMQEATTAWRMSKYLPDPTHGATHWENINKFGKPKWAGKMVETARVRNHVFYKK